jgi:hypothetical protein
MHPGKEIAGPVATSIRCDAEHLSGVGTALRSSRKRVPRERHHPACDEGLPQPDLAFPEGYVGLLALTDLAGDLGDQRGQKPPIADSENTQQLVAALVQEEKTLHGTRDQDARHVAERSRRYR